MQFLKKQAAKLWAKQTADKYDKIRRQALRDQIKWFNLLLNEGRKTRFGKEHGLDEVVVYEQFRDAVPLMTYEDYRPYIERIKEGAENELWPGRPLYFAKTSGTTSGVKYIPISKQSMPYHVDAARDLLLLYIHQSGNTDFLNGKMIFLQGSPRLTSVGGIPTGRLSGIAAHYVPKYLQGNRMPSEETNLIVIENWEEKVNRIVDETVGENMTLISGIPSWVNNYFEKLVERTGKPVGEIFPNFSVFVHGGVNFEPYKNRFMQLTGRPVDMLETYPASEGFIAFRDDYTRDDMLLLTDHGMYYEFVPVESLRKGKPERLWLAEVQPGRDYAIVLTTNAGLWSYLIGDIVRFTSVRPYRLKVTGRIHHYISAFGEHVIAQEAEKALQTAAERTGAIVNAFTVAPQVEPAEGLPYHEWLVEFEKEPASTQEFMEIIDRSMQEQNIYYADLVKGKILRPAVLSSLKKGAFNRYMRSMQWDPQNKIPTVKNDRSLADWFYQHDEIIRSYH